MSNIKLFDINTVHTIFIDRDGVINKKLEGGSPYVTCWDKFRFLPGALEGIRMLNKVSKHVIVVTNQRGIARGLMTESDLIKIHNQMEAAIVSYGGRLDGIYHCPHDHHQCFCRKPSRLTCQTKPFRTCTVVRPVSQVFQSLFSELVLLENWAMKFTFLQNMENRCGTI